MGFLDDLIGLKNVIAPDGTTMPRRYALSFEGTAFSVKDDPIQKLTRIRMGGATEGELSTVTWTMTTDDNLCTAPGLGAAELVRLTAADADWTLIGLDAGLSPARRRKILLNVGPETILIGDLGGETPDGAKIFVPAGESVALPYNGALEVIWVPTMGEENAGWRLL